MMRRLSFALLASVAVALSMASCRSCEDGDGSAFLEEHDYYVPWWIEK